MRLYQLLEEVQRLIAAHGDTVETNALSIHRAFIGAYPYIEIGAEAPGLQDKLDSALDEVDRLREEKDSLEDTVNDLEKRMSKIRDLSY